MIVKVQLTSFGNREIRDSISVWPHCNRWRHTETKHRDVVHCNITQVEAIWDDKVFLNLSRIHTKVKYQIHLLSDTSQNGHDHKCFGSFCQISTFISVQTNHGICVDVQFYKIQLQLIFVEILTKRLIYPCTQSPMKIKHSGS